MLKLFMMTSGILASFLEGRGHSLPKEGPMYVSKLLLGAVLIVLKFKSVCFFLKTYLVNSEHLEPYERHTVPAHALSKPPPPLFPHPRPRYSHGKKREDSRGSEERCLLA